MAFPSTSVLDSFTRADENPVAGGWSSPTRPSANVCKVVSNELAPDSISGSAAYSYWSSSSFAADQEVFYTVTQVPAGFSATVQARIVSPNSLLVDYYQFGYADGVGWRMYVVTDNGYTKLGSTVASPAMSAGDAVGLKCEGSTITGYGRIAGVWSPLISLTDSTVTSGGFIGVELAGSLSVRIDDFGGGDVVPDPPSVASVAWITA